MEIRKDMLDIKKYINNINTSITPLALGLKNCVAELKNICEKTASLDAKVNKTEKNNITIIRC